MSGVETKKTSLFWDFLFPKECIFCGEEGNWICQNCFLFLEFRENNSCLNCHRRHHKVKKGLCPECRNLFSLDGIIVAGDYKQERIKKAIKTLKYRFIKDLAQDLGDFVSYFLYETGNIKSVTGTNTELIPIPLYWKRENWRGFNQAQLISERLARNLNLKLNSDLKRIKYKKPQTKLKKQARQKNIKNSFQWKGESLQGKTIILADDIVTTGATMNEAARILKQNGAKKVIGLVVAGES